MPVVRFLSPVPVRAAEPEPPEPAPPAPPEPGEPEPEPTAPARTIEGQLMPYGVESVASDGMRYLFQPGSLHASRPCTPALLGHDPQRPAGILRELRQSDQACIAVIAADPTPDGDLALAQAASGSRAGLSIGAEPTEFTIAEGDVIHVQAAELHELSLVAIPAWRDALVSVVNAQHGGSPMSTIAAGAPDSPESVQPPLPVPTESAHERAAAIVGSHHERIVSGAHLPLRIGERAPRLTADAYVSALVRAARGDAAAQAIVQAAIVPSFVVDNPGALPPTITNDLLGELPANRALVSVCARHPMPASGMMIRKPIWTARPNGGWMADDQAPVPTNTPKIGLHDANVEQWAYAFATSQAVAERSSPDFVEAVFRNAIIDYHNDVEARIATLITTDASATAVTLGGAIAAVYASTGRVADVLVMAPDAFGEMIDAEGQARFVAGSASVAGAELRGSIAGLDVLVSGALPAGFAAAGVRGAIDFRETDPIRLSANVVGAMQIELGVTSFALFDQELPDAFVQAAIPTVAPVAPAARSKS